MKVLLTADWLHLLFVSYAVDPAALAGRVPAGTELDTYEGRAYLSLVAYQFRSLRIAGLPVPNYQDFEGLNLRFPVRHEHNGQVRHGVVFISEIVPRLAMAALTRLFFNEPYSARPMQSSVDDGPPVRATYAWQVGERWHRASAVMPGTGVTPRPSSLEAFLVDRHWSYTRQSDGSTLEYRVEHEPWKMLPASSSRVAADFTALYGPETGALLGTPASVLLAHGSPVRIYWPERLAQEAGVGA